MRKASRRSLCGVALTIYDALGRLTQEGYVTGMQNTGTVSYAYDSVGNRAEMTDTRSGGAVVTEYSYDLNNRLLQTSETLPDGVIQQALYIYDNNGNQVSRRNETLTPAGVTAGVESIAFGGQYQVNEWNAAGQLIGMQNQEHEAEYTYNPSGMRHSKTVDGVLTVHVWDGGNIAAEKSGSSTVAYIRGIGLLWSVDNANHVGIYTYNAHGDVVGIIDPSKPIAQRTESSYSYDAFGNQLDDDGVPIQWTLAAAFGQGYSNPFRYSGEYFDEETGYQYLRARYYDSSVGGFVSEDPIRDGLNWYVYCSGNPVMFVDPSGLVNVNAEEYAKTYNGAKVTYNYYFDDSSAFGSTFASFITITLGDASINVLGYPNKGSYICDDSLFVNAFGIGTNSIVVYEDPTTGNVSIRAAFNIVGTEADTPIDGTTYRALFLQGIEEGWSSSTVSAYARESSKGINASIKSGDGVSRVYYPDSFLWFGGWSKSNPGRTLIDILDRDGSGNLKTADDFMWSVTHEFGHLLGLGDAYNSQNSTGVTSVMNVRGTAVQPEDIAKVLNVWKTGKYYKWS